MFCLPLCCAGQAYREVAERAFAALQAGNYTLAIATYDSMLARFKPEGADLYNMACGHARLNQKDQAIYFLNQSFENGYRDFDHAYYDKDLNSLRNEIAYRQFEKKYRPDSVIYLFDILREMMKGNEWAEFDNKRVAMLEREVGTYSISDIQERLGPDVILPTRGDSIIDLSGKRLQFKKCRFVDEIQSYHALENVAFKTLLIEDCYGGLMLSHIDVDNLLFYENAVGGGSNYLYGLRLFNVTQHGEVSMQAKGIVFQVSNSSFTSIANDSEDETSFQMFMTYQRVEIVNSTFNSIPVPKKSEPQMLFVEGDFLTITNSKFLYPITIYGDIDKRLNVDENDFASQLDLLSLKFPDFDSYFPFEQLEDTQIIKTKYDNNNVLTIKGDSIEDFADKGTFDEFTGLYKRLYDTYRDRADIASANAVYVRMKELEVMHLSNMTDRSPEETMRLRLNQIMGMYTDHATSPGKALIVSFYIIFLFGIFYCFFPSDWDKTSKARVITDFRLFIEKNEHGYLKPFFKMAKGILLSLLNAMALSLNAFITLGFGNIPTSGVARYVCILEGALGWFLLSLFTVALLNQVLL